MFKVFHARRVFAGPACMEREHEKARPRTMLASEALAQAHSDTWRERARRRVLLQSE